jgi:hypothetical protein
MQQLKNHQLTKKKMNRKIIATSILLNLSMLCHALNFDKNMCYDFDGKLGATELQFSIFIPDSGNVLKGNYCYKKYDTKIQLIGQLNCDQIELTEYHNGKPNGHFIGKVFTDNQDRFEGTWTDSSGTKHLDFKMALSSASYASAWNHRYTDFSGTDEDVENFMKKVKSAILKGDKEWMASHIRYPISASLNGKKSTKIKSKQQLIDNFDKVFYQAFKDNIKSSCVCNMFNNYQGTMLGSGIIWITDNSNTTKVKLDYQIIAINNR